MSMRLINKVELVDAKDVALVIKDEGVVMLCARDDLKVSAALVIGLALASMLSDGSPELFKLIDAEVEKHGMYSEPSTLQ